MTTRVGKTLRNHFDSVADMKTAKGLKVGDHVQTLGYYSPNDGGAAEYIVVNSGTGVSDDATYIELHDSIQAELIITNSMSIRVFGGDPALGDNSSAIKAALESSAEKITGEGTSTAYNITQDITVEGHSVELTDLWIKGNGAQLTIQGTLTELGSLTAGGVVNTDSISYGSVSSIGEGAYVVIQNQVDSSFSQHRPVYYDGEFNLVRETNGNDIILESLLSSTYPVAATTKIFRMNPVKVKTTNCKFTGGTVYALIIRFAADCALVNTECRNDTTGGLALIKCYGVNITGGRYVNNGDVSGGLQYGIAITNSQNVVIDNAKTYGTRHGVTTGGDAEDGAVPCRYIIIQNSVVAGAGSIYAADFHGNTVDSYYINCSISNSIGLAGERCGVINCKIVGNSAIIPIQLQEVVGGAIKIHDNIVSLGSSCTSDKIVGHGSSSIAANIDRDYHIDIRNLKTDVIAATTHIVAAFHNAATSIKHKWTVEVLDVEPIDDSNMTEIIDATVTGTGIRPEVLRLSELNYAPHPTYVKYLTLNSLVAFAGCQCTLPTTTRRANVGIRAGVSFSDQDGPGSPSTGGTLLYNFPDYPIPPTIKTALSSVIKGAEFTVFPVVAQLDESQVQVYASTAGNVSDLSVETYFDIDVEVSMNGVIL